MKVPAKIRRRIVALRREIDEHNRRYYLLNEPTIGDPEYDDLFRELLDLEAEYPAVQSSSSPTQKVAGGLIGGLPQVDLRVPMLSIPSMFSEEEIEAFDERVRSALAPEDVVYDCELKFDGVATNLTYVDGELVQAALRGTGTRGEDVTEQVRHVSGIPTRLALSPSGKSSIFEVRGEVVMTKTDFAALNESLIAKGKKPVVNPRNAAAGALRQFRVSNLDRKPLTFFAYGSGEISGVSKPDRQSELLDELLSLGFTVSPQRQVVKATEEMFAFFRRIDSNRTSIDFDVDGIVYKVNSIAQQARLGSVGKDVKWAAAHKFRAETKHTRLLKVDFQVGRTGALTPVARLESVFVGQATVSNATLHNERQLRDRDIHLGDIVIVRRAGDVIPEIVGVYQKGSPRGAAVTVPDECPVCESHVEKNEERTLAWCTGGLVCSAQLQQRLLHFCSRTAMDIQGVGEKLAAVLVDEVGLQSPAELFRLPTLVAEWTTSLGSDVSVESLLPATTRSSTVYTRVHAEFLRNRSGKMPVSYLSWLKSHKPELRRDVEILLLAMLPKSPDVDPDESLVRRLGDKDAVSLLSQMGSSKRVEFSRFVFALGIPHVGREMANRLATTGMTWTDFETKDWLDLRDKKVASSKKKGDASKSDPAFFGIGPEIFKSLNEFFSESHNRKVARDLFSEGVEIEYPKAKPTSELPLSGTTILFTGTLSGMSRLEAERLAAKLGAKIATGVSKRLTYLVEGDDPGSKVEAAKKSGVKILNQEAFENLLKRGG